jgi:hypothetical protein
LERYWRQTDSACSASRRARSEAWIDMVSPR